MNNVNLFIMDTMIANPKAKFYWDGSKYIMELHSGIKYHFGSNKIPFKIQKDDATQALYYIDEKSRRNYLIYFSYID